MARMLSLRDRDMFKYVIAAGVVLSGGAVLWYWRRHKSGSEVKPSGSTTRGAPETSSPGKPKVNDKKVHDSKALSMAIM